jgi:hypothetical protein
MSKNEGCTQNKVFLQFLSSESFRLLEKLCSEPVPFSDPVPFCRASRRELWLQLLACIALDQVPLRPNRHEPRAVKRRPKPYQFLTKPRRRFKEVPHRCRHYKTQTSKNRALI